MVQAQTAGGTSLISAMFNQRWHPSF